MLLKLRFNYQKYQTGPVPDEVENELWELGRLWGTTQRYPHSSAALLAWPEPKRFFFLCADYCSTSSECKMKNSGNEYKLNFLNDIYRLFFLRESSLPHLESVANFCCIPRFLQHWISDECFSSSNLRQRQCVSKMKHLYCTLLFCRREKSLKTPHYGG